MNVSCQYYSLPNGDPLRTHERILVQEVMGHTGMSGWVDDGYCALFNVTYLGGYIPWSGDDHLDKKERFGSKPYYDLRVTMDTQVQETTCWQKLQNISRETGQNITICTFKRQPIPSLDI
ncbi:uncharacterized protein [Dermacentor andersoni]|uniref:uncharacterized protein n=1 Tax=Dermacentor andersoni TaxID=34620 RepID=UPI003B3A47C1